MLYNSYIFTVKVVFSLHLSQLSLILPLTDNIITLHTTLTSDLFAWTIWGDRNSTSRTKLIMSEPNIQARSTEDMLIGTDNWLLHLKKNVTKCKIMADIKFNNIYNNLKEN